MKVSEKSLNEGIFVPFSSKLRRGEICGSSDSFQIPYFLEINERKRAVSEVLGGSNFQVPFFLKLSDVSEEQLSGPSFHEEVTFGHFLESVEQAEEFSVGSISVKKFNSQTPFVLPDLIEGPAISGKGNGFEKKEIIPRISLMYEVLEKLGVETVSVYEGSTSNSQFRKVPYMLFIIEELDRAVLICEESGNRTFVKSGLSSLEKFSFSRKSDLKQREDVKSVVWTGFENWKEKISELLSGDFYESQKVLPPSVCVENSLNDNIDESSFEEDSPFDKNFMRVYFSDIENIRNDLSVFAEAFSNYANEYGNPKIPNDGTISSLSVGLVANSILVDTGFGRAVNLVEYLSLLRKFTKTYKRQPLTKVLVDLKKQLGFSEKADFLYANPSVENIRNDLEGFAKKVGFDSVFDLRIDQYKGNKLMRSDGVEMYFLSYLEILGVSMGWVKSRKEARSVKKYILSKALNFAYENYNDISLRPSSYYEDLENISYDFSRFLEEQKREFPEIQIPNESLLLSYSKRSFLKTICRDGVCLTLDQYLHHIKVSVKKYSGWSLAGIFLDIQRSIGNAVRVYGNVELGKEYSFVTLELLLNPEKLKVVLDSMAKSRNDVKLNRSYKISGPKLCRSGADLSLKQEIDKDVFIWDDNGNLLFYRELLEKSGKLLWGIAKYLPEEYEKFKVAYSSHSFVLKKLKFLAGYEGVVDPIVPELKKDEEKKKVFPKMDAVYFANLENVKTDLEEFWNVFKNSGKLKESHTKKNWPVYFTWNDLALCQNGEPLCFQTYLARAKVALSLPKECSWTFVLRRLTFLVGFPECEEPVCV